jgi:D-alanyl-D-alanine carboxypeptidase (penicillin-binding protein 5/6)
MKRYITTILVFILMFLVFLPEAFAAQAFDPSNINAKSILLIDITSGKVLVNKDENAKIYPAGPTKLMTLLVALEQGGLDKTVTVGDEIKALGAGSSKMGLTTGEKISVQDLLYGMMITSGNDAALSLAVHYGGSISGFADMMNAKAKELGMSNSNFTNPHGIQDQNHYSTALDISKLVLYGLKNSDWKKIICTPSYDIPKTNSTAGKTVYTTDLLINPQQQYAQYNYQYAEGGSAGQTNSSGSCLVAVAKKDNAELLTIIYGDSSANGTERWTIAKNLFDSGFNSYSVTDNKSNPNTTDSTSTAKNSASANASPSSSDSAGSGNEMTASASDISPNSPVNLQPTKELFQTESISPWWWLLIPAVLVLIMIIRVARLNRRRSSRFSKRKIHSYRIK